MAYRNMMRHKRRSLLTALAMIFGYVLMSISLCIADGMYSNIIDLFTRNKVGHVQIHFSDYLDNPNLYKTIAENSGILKVLKADKKVEAYAPRVYGGGLSFYKNKSMAVRLIGIDPVLEPKTTTIKQRLSKGEFFKDTNAYEALIGETIAKVLKISIGDKLIVISQGADASVANDLFTVKGIMPKIEGNCVYVPMGALQEFLVLEGKVHEYAVIGNHQKNSRKIARTLSEEITDKNIDIKPWQIVEKEFYKAMMADLKGNYFSMIIIMIIVALGVLNSILMNVLNRTREFGVIKAMGTRPSRIFKLIMSEMIILSLLSIAAGAVIATFANYYFVGVGIQYAQPLTYGGIIIKSVHGAYTLSSYLEPALVVFLTTISVSMYPAVKAAKIIPVKALRAV
ncbi:MAG: ABC transporter permease [Desulfobacula sp.]|nr:ABC transporter permease [Desulfobacula sp.]